MKKKHSYLLILFFLIINNVIGQDLSNNINNFKLGIYIPDNSENIDQNTKNVLSNKLSKLLANSNILCSTNQERFILTIYPIILSKKVTATTIPLISYTIDFTFYIGDGIDGIKFNSSSVIVKGVGENENIAFLNAANNLNVNSNQLLEFVNSGENRIIQYYDSNCDKLISDAQIFADQELFNDAILLLNSVPIICSNCINKSNILINKIFNDKINNECNKQLSDSRFLWNSSKKVESIEKISNLLSKINPNSACYKEAIEFSNNINKYLIEKDKRDYMLDLKKYQDGIDFEKSLLKYTKEIQLENAKNKASYIVEYNVNGWW